MISIWHLLLLLAFLSVIIPVARILGRLGFSPWLAALSIIPWVNLVAIWVLAFIRWPAARSKAEVF